MLSRITFYYRRLKRAYEFAKFSFSTYDFDCAYMFIILEFFLKRLLNSILTGYPIVDKDYKPHLAALKEAIKLTRKLYEDEYEDNYYDKHNKKWQRINRRKFIDKDGNWIPTTYRKVKTPRQKVQQRKEFLAIPSLADKDRCRDLDRLNQLFKEHMLYWWD